MEGEVEVEMKDGRIVQTVGIGIYLVTSGGPKHGHPDLKVLVVPIVAISKSPKGARV